MAHRKSPTLPSAPTSAQSAALAEYHVLWDHAGPAEHCPACAGQLERQRHAAATLRAHQRQARQRAGAIVGDLGPEDPRVVGADCPKCQQRDCRGHGHGHGVPIYWAPAIGGFVTIPTDEDPGDEQAQLRRDEELDDLGPDDEPLFERWERWGW